MAVIPSPVLKILRWQHGRLILTGLLFICLMAGLYVFQPRFIQFMEHKVYDVLFQSVHSTELSGAVGVVDLDEASLAEYGQWPWPRYRVALMLEKIRRAGAASIALDIVFAEEDNTSPAVLQRMLKNELGVDVGFSGLPPGLEDSDAVLAGILGLGPYVLGYYFRVESPEAGQGPPQLALEGADTEAPQDTEEGPASPHTLNAAVLRAAGAVTAGQALFEAGGVVGNIPVLARAAPGSGFINVGADRDGIVRRAPLVMTWEDKIYPSLALAAVLKAMGLDGSAGSGGGAAVLRLTTGGVESLRLADRVVPLDARGRMLVHYRGGRFTFPTYSVRHVLKDRLEPGALDGKSSSSAPPRQG